MSEKTDTSCALCGASVPLWRSSLHIKWHQEINGYMEQPDEPEAPAVIVEMAKAICDAGIHDKKYYDLEDFLPEARATLRCVVKTLENWIGDWCNDPDIAEEICHALGLTQAQLDDLMSDPNGMAEGRRGLMDDDWLTEDLFQKCIMAFANRDKHSGGAIGAVVSILEAAVASDALVPRSRLEPFFEWCEFHRQSYDVCRFGGLFGCKKFQLYRTLPAPEGAES